MEVVKINECKYSLELLCSHSKIVTGSEKRGHFAQIPNFGFKILITLKL